MNETTFLSDKFAPAALPGVVAPRSKLLGTFNRASQERFVYISAPAGSGKTVSALLWLESVNRKTVWIGLDKYDSTPSVFFRQLATGLFSAQPDNQGMYAVLSDPTFSSSPVEHTVRLISELLPEDTTRALVLDDLHLVQNSEIFKAIPLIMHRLPHNFVVLVLSRFDPPEEFAPLIRTHTLIGSKQIRFSEEEIRSYFGSLGVNLTPAEIHTAYTSTEGWAMGVNALAQSGVLGTSKGYDFTAYFEQQIWDRWPSDLRDFCLSTAILNEFNPDLAALLSGRLDTDVLLAELSRTNSFLSRLREDEYRYHHLFQDFLRQKLKKERGKDVSSLYIKVAEYYRHLGDYSRALRFFMGSEDWKDMDGYLLLFLFHNDRGGVADYADFLKVFFDEGFPEKAYKEMPVLHVLAAWYYYLTSYYEEYAYHMDAILKHLPAIAKAGDVFAEFSMLAFSVDHRRTLQQKEKMYGLFSRFIKKYTPEGLATNIASYTHGLPYLNRCNIDYNEFANDPDWENGLGRAFASFLGEEYSYLKHNMNAVIAYERGHSEEALRLNNKAAATITPHHKIEGRICVALLQHSILWQLNRKNEALLAFGALRTLVETDAQDFLHNLEAYQVKLRLYSGDRKVAREWLSQYYVFETDHIELFRVFMHFTTARAYMALGEYPKARRLLIMLRDYGQNLNRPMDRCEALVLLAALNQAEGKRKEADSDLTAALLISQHFNYIRTIADEGNILIPILKRQLSKLTDQVENSALRREYVNEVMLACRAFEKKHPGYMVLHSQDTRKQVKLSKQQAQVITLLSQGMRNTEICRVMGLGLPTIKTHTSLAYQKLGVNNAMDAVLMARELGLIE
jgi:LuxR family maltose regulon positive regulatory protein